MNEKMDLFQTNIQFTLSFEFLYVLKWLSENYPNKLQKIIQEALETGLSSKLLLIKNNPKSCDNNSLQNGIIQFLELLESIYFKVSNEQLNNKAFEKDLIPKINQIDPNSCNETSIYTTVENTIKKATQEKSKNPKAILFTELLNQWKPGKKQIPN